ncbi:MAG: hypothetical protein ACFE9A_19095 [Candidatus Hodarchaeota archaeon]
MSGEQVKLEVDRVVNLTQGFGWAMERQEYVDGKISVVLTKTLTVGEAEAAAGATPS